MPRCPICDTPMRVARSVSVAGVRDKPVSWRCHADDVEAGAVHPVQIGHLRVGDEERDGARMLRVVHLEMQGAELLVFRQAVAATTGAETGDG